MFPAGTQWSLRRSVYGLRQAPREWHDTLRTTLAALGFAPSTTDPLLFLRTDTSLPLFYVLVYVDDIVFATAVTEALTIVKSELQKRHTCTDLGELHSYLGLQITRDRARRTITLTQSHMVHQVLQRFGFQFSSPQPTPLSTGHSLSAPPSDESIEPSGPYPELVGCLITLGMGLVLGGRGPVVLTGHADASWVDDSATLRSSKGYTFSLGSGSVSWRSTCSSSVLSSSCEAEIYVGAMASQELRWLTYLLTDLGEQPRSPPQRGQLCLAYVSTRANTADIFTKALPPCDHQRFSTVLGLLALLFLTGLVITCSPPLCLRGLRATLTAPLAAPCGPPTANCCCLPSALRCPASPCPLCCTAMASLCVLAFEHEGRPIQFETWLDDLQLYLLSDSRDSVSLFGHTSGAAPAPLATADSATRLHCPPLPPSHLRRSLPRCRYRAATPAEFLHKNQPLMFITLYIIVTHLPDSLRSLKDHFLSLDPTVLTVDLLEQHLLAAETSVVADVGAASASTKCCSSKGKGGRGGGGGSGSGSGGSSGGSGGSGGGGCGGSGGGCGSVGGGGGGSGGSGGSGSGGSGGGRTGAQCGGSGGGQRQRQQRQSETPSPQQLRKPHTQHRCFSRLEDAWRAEFGDDVERPHKAELLRSGVAIFDLDYDAILSATYALSVSAEGDCYRCVPPDLGLAYLHAGLRCFTLDSGPSRCFFRDSTTLTPLRAPVTVRLADPSRGPVIARSSTVLPCPAVPSGSLSGLHLPSFSRNFVSTAALQDSMVTTTTPGGQHLSICTSTQTGRHLATFTRRARSSLYTLATEPPQVAASAQVSASGQRAAPHSSSFPPTTAPLQTLHMDVCGPARVSGQSRERYFLLVDDDYSRYTTVFPLRSKGQVVDVLIPWIRTVRLQLRERLGQDPPVLRLHSDRGGEFSSTLLREFCHGEGILQSFTLPDSPQQNGIAERHIGLVMEVARTSMIHAAPPHFLWPFAVRYAAHQLNLWPRVSLPKTSPTLRWMGKVGDASVFRVWGSRAFVRNTSADKLSPRAIPCVFLGFVPDAPGWQFYHPTSRRVFPSHDITFDESVPFYRLFPYRSAPPPPPPLFLAPGPPLVDPLPPQGRAPSGVSQVDPLPGTVPVEVAGDSGAARGAAFGGAASGGAEPGGANSEGAGFGGAGLGRVEPGGAEPAGVEPGGAEPEGFEPGVAESEGAESGGAEPRGAASSGGPAGTSARLSPRPEPLSPQQLREWLVRRARLWSGATGAGATGDIGDGGARVTAGAGGTGGTAAAGLGGARTRGTGVVGTGGVGGAGAGDPTEPGAARARGAGARGIGAGGAGAGGAGAGGTGAGGGGATRAAAGGTCAGGAGAGGAGAIDPGAGGAGSGGAGGIGAGGTVRLRAYFIPLRQQSAGLTERREPASHLVSHVCIAHRVPRPRPPPVPGTHAMALRPSSVALCVPLPPPPESSLPAVPAPESDLVRAASPTVSRFLTSVVADPSFESTAASSLFAKLLDFAAACRLDDATALDDFECLAADVPRFASMLLAPEGEPDPQDIPTPRSYAEAITGPQSSQCQAAMDAEMASWKSTGTYVDAVPPSRANIVDGMWIFRGVDYFQTFSPTPKMTTLRVLLHVAAQHDYELHSLDFSTAFLHGSLHEEIWLRRPPGFIGSFLAGTQWRLRRLCPTVPRPRWQLTT
ncbi:unnamed protein product [Closterium sp. NIES-53]